MQPLLISTERGLYCEAGDFYIDPIRAVDRAIITHAHSDHARRGSKNYLCARSGSGVLRARVGFNSQIQTVEFGERIYTNGVAVSLHPAGHILGSAQVRVEHAGEVWVATGDYKLGEYSIADREEFELLRCNTLISECTFGRSIYRWSSNTEILSEINNWWKDNQANRMFSVIGAYSLGKAQRILAGLDPAVGPIYCHPDVRAFNKLYEQEGIKLFAAHSTAKANIKKYGPGIVIAPPSMVTSEHWIGLFQPAVTAFASGWMIVKGSEKWRGVDRGFTLSDHSDWDGLIRTAVESGAENVYLDHGNSKHLERHLYEHHGLNARDLKATPRVRQLAFHGL